MPWSNYRKIREIGSGSYGRAFLVQAAQQQHLVMKEIDLSGRNAQEHASAEQEAKVLSALKHPYIVRYWESFMHDRSLCIIMDYCEGGDMWQHIQLCRRQRATINEPQVLRWFTQMSLAMKYMHEKNVLHRDIKTQNIFLAKKVGGVLGCLKIADFGIAKVLGEGSHAFARTVVGTPYYLSPEIIQKQPYARPSDIWAMGCVLYELCALRVPFEAQELPQLVERIVRGPLPRITGYSSEVSQLGSELLLRDASRRPTAASILQRPFIQAEIKRMLAENQKEGNEPARAEPARGEPVRRSRSSSVTPRPPGVEREDSNRPAARRPLGENNGRDRPRAHSKPGSRAPSPQKGAALEVLRAPSHGWARP
mmetsp:Transcript_61689/g.133653  ORF Transcript_61689/g.133653 Transcript_61689/m.133653 type:complete len:366 (-) Transcript_61689:169-1266(-)